MHKGIWWSLSLCKIWAEWVRLENAYSNHPKLGVLLGKVDKSSPKQEMTCYASVRLTVPNFIAVSQMYEKSITKLFYTPYFLGAPGGPPGAKFTSLHGDVHQGTLYEAAKFCPLPTIPLPDICCQSSSISWMAWPTDRQTTNTQKTVNDIVPTYHAATNKATVESWLCPQAFTPHVAGYQPMAAARMLSSLTPSVATLWV